jgi:hypothetical protein
MRDKLLLAAAVLLTATMPLQAQADCKKKLAEVDQRMASPQMAANQRNAVQQFRDRAAQMCNQGNDATAMQTLGIIEMMLPPSQAQQERAAAAKQVDERTKSRLTNKFLQGVWCSVSGEERAQLVFAANGTYRACFPNSATRSYGSCTRSKATAKWIENSGRVESLEQDRMVIARRETYKRGDCSRHGR